MTAEDGDTTIEFTEFALRYVNDRQFALWFGVLGRFLRTASAGDPLCVDRLVICGAELRALVNFLDPEHHVAGARRIRDLERVTTPGLAERVVQHVAPWVEPAVPRDGAALADGEGGMTVQPTTGPAR